MEHNTLLPVSALLCQNTKCQVITFRFCLSAFNDALSDCSSHGEAICSFEINTSLLTRQQQLGQFVVLRLTQESADKAAAAGAICSVEINTDFADKAQQW